MWTALLWLARATMLWGLVSGPGAWAQGLTDGAVRGQVVGVDGQPLAAGAVRLRPLDGPSGPVAAVRTDRGGGFLLVGVVPGTYGLEVLLPGAMTWVSSGKLAVEAGEVRDLALRLQVRAGAVGLEVSALGEEDTGEGLEVARAGPPMDAKGAAPARGLRDTNGTTEAAGALNVLPVPERQWETVEALVSAAEDATLAGSGSAQDATEEEETATARSERETGSAAEGLSFDGLPANQNAQVVDGLSADQEFSGGPRGAVRGGASMGSTFAQGAVGSVRILPHTYSAQYGGAAGGTVVVRSRRAETGVHGSAFAQTRQSAWAAMNPFAVVTHFHDGVVSGALVRPGFSDTQLGGAVGVPLRLPGALRGWHAGVFAAVEAQERKETLFSAPETASFYQLSAMQLALLGNRGVSTAAAFAAMDYLDGLTGTVAERSPRMLNFVRLDATPGRWDRVSAAAQVHRMSSPATGGGEVSEGVIDRGVSSIGGNQTEVEAYTAGWQHGFGLRANNSLQLQFAHDLQFETAGAPAVQEPAVGPGGLAPQVAIAPEGFSYGTPASLGRVAYPDEQRFEVGESLALRLGRHLLTAGGDWSRLHDRVLGATNLEGSFLYDSGNTGGHAGGLVDWITDYTFNVNAYPNGGCPSVFAKTHYFCFRSYTQSFESAATEFATHHVAGYAEDALRLGPSLRVSLGARYEYLLLPFPQAPDAALDATLRTLGGPAAGVTATFPEDRNNVGPRVSVAWSPGVRRHRPWFVVQAGYGMFFGRLPGATLDAALSETGVSGATTGIRILPTVETECPQVANQGFGYPCSFVSAPPGVVAVTRQTVVFSSHFRMPAVQRGSFGLEREFGRRLLVRGEYATAWTTQLPESTDLNIAPSTSTVAYVLQGGDGHRGLYSGQSFEVPLYTARRASSFGPVTALVSNANATYHSGIAEVRLRDWHGWGLRGSYTFARAIDYGPQGSATPRLDGQFDPFSNGYDKGLSSLQFAHHFTGDVMFRSAWRSGPREVRALFSGWRLAAVGTAGSGAPYSYVIFGGTRLSGGRESINGSGGATYLPTVGRNTLRLPPRAAVNLRTARELPFLRGTRLQLQADAFNVLNSVSVSRVETRAFLVGTPAATGAPTPLVFQDAATIAAEGLNTPAFGAPLSSTSGLSRERQISLGARWSF